MNPSPRLSKLQVSGHRRVARLRSLVEPLGLPATAEKDRQVAWVVIEARNLWAGFLRAYYLSGAINTRTSSGARVSFASTPLPSVSAALIYAVRLLKVKTFSSTTVRRQDEPAWHNISGYLKLCTSVGISNLPQIYAALSYPTTFFELLTPVRNFYAHRCNETVRKAGKVGVKLGLAATPNLRASQIMCSKLPRRPQNVITDWLDDIEAVIDLFCS